MVNVLTFDMACVLAPLKEWLMHIQPINPNRVHVGEMILFERMLKPLVQIASTPRIDSNLLYQEFQMEYTTWLLPIYGQEQTDQVFKLFINAVEYLMQALVNSGYDRELDSGLVFNGFTNDKGYIIMMRS